MTERVFHGPLKGLKVIELPAIGPVPLAGLLLSGLGADVIRITRAQPLARPSYKKDARFDLLFGNRPTISLDLKSEAGRLALLGLVDKADVLIEGFRPGVCERLGIGPEVCLQRQPALVYGRVTGWGQDGPMAPRAGHDINYLALTGALHAIGARGCGPVPPLNLLGDFAGGSLFSLIGILSALLSAKVSGKGQVIDVSMVDGVHALMTLFHGLWAGGMHTPERGTNQLDGGCPVYTTYRTRDGRYVAVGALEPAFYQQLIQTLQVEDVPPPGEHRLEKHADSLREKLTRAFLTRTRDEWSSLFETTDACVTPVLELGEVALHPHNLARNAFVTRDGISRPRFAPRFSETSLDDPQPQMPEEDVRNALHRWGWSDQDASACLLAKDEAPSP